MQLEDKINELKAAAPDQTAIQKQEEMQNYWRQVLTLNGLGKEKAPKNGAEKPLTQQLWLTL